MGRKVLGIIVGLVVALVLLGVLAGVCVWVVEMEWVSRVPMKIAGTLGIGCMVAGYSAYGLIANRDTAPKSDGDA